MFKIDKSSVESINANKEVVVIKQWLRNNGSEFSDDTAAQGKPDSSVENGRTLADSADTDERPWQQNGILSAEKEAQRLLDEARAQADQVREQARQEAEEQAAKRAEAFCERIQAENEKQLNAALKTLFQMQAQAETVLEQNLLQLSLEIAQKIIHIELEKNDTVFEDLVRQAVRKINIKGECTLKLNPREYQRHFADGGDWLVSEMSAPYEVVADSTVPPGGCVVELQNCVVRVGVDAQIKMIAMALNGQAGG